MDVVLPAGTIVTRDGTAAEMLLLPKLGNKLTIRLHRCHRL